MARRKKAKKTYDLLGAYRKIRKKMPPPEKVIPDKRREIREEETRRELRDEP